MLLATLPSFSIAFSSSISGRLPSTALSLSVSRSSGPKLAEMEVEVEEEDKGAREGDSKGEEVFREGAFIPSLV